MVKFALLVRPLTIITSSRIGRLFESLGQTLDFEDIRYDYLVDKENSLGASYFLLPNCNNLKQVPPEALAAHDAWVKGQKEVVVLITKAMFSKQVKGTLQTVREFHNLHARGRELALQGLRGSKKLKPGALSLYVGDGHRAAVEAIGTYHLELPSGLVIVLNNCHYAPSITRVVISVSRLFDDGFVNRFDDNNVISVSKDNLVYFMASTGGLFWKLIYPKETMGYSFYSPSENKVFVARNAEFFESKLLDLKASGSVEDLELIQEEDTNPSVETSLNHEEDDQEIDEPAKKWLDAMNVEMQSMKDNDVWVLVELPPNARTVGSKWLFKKKTDMDGWCRYKTKYFCTSSTDADLYRCFDASKKAVWIRKFISGLGHFHYLRETIKMGDVKIEKIDKDDNLADPFTKALAFPKHSELTRNIGLLPASSFM
ncbi:hypothetical protein Tco_0692283 [Tanacetum coccineum]